VDSFLPYQDPAVVSRKLDSESLAVGLNTVERERMQLAGALAAEIARVLNAAPVGTDYGLVTRNIPSGTQLVDGSGVVQPVSAVNLDIRDLVFALDKVDVSGSTGVVVTGNVAHNVADTGNPLKVGGRAQAIQITAATDGARVDAIYDRHGNQRVRIGPPAASVFTNVNFPASNTRASSTRAAGATGVRHVLTGLTAILAGGVTAPSVAVQVDVRVRDGVLDTGTILWQAVMTLPAIAGVMNGITRSGLWIPGTAATAMTIEFSAVAGGANTYESVSMEITDITE